MHTAAPWTANLHHTQERAGRTYGFIQADGVVPVAAVVLGVEGYSQDEGRANAKAIAATPDFMEAAAMMTASEQSGGTMWWRGFEMLKAAYKKAGGEFPSMNDQQ